ncbi:MAG: glycosyltransferase family 2 protein [Candidatus Margulisbacteria bacterium]|nr:glycosyltransferase family 2 protein [Candidatus Margulisiibacteriota bacterium]
MEKILLSVAIITKNEKENIRQCLQSISFAGQIVIVDSGSTDNTLEIAAEFGCEIYSEAWRGFGPQKQSAIDKCSQPWILVLDADERIPPDTANIIKKIVTDSNVKDAGFSFPRKNYFQGRWIKHAGWWPDRIVRLFRKEAGRITTAMVHESVEVQGMIGVLDVPIEHYTESSLSKIIQKIDKYSTLGAQEAFKDGKHSSVFSAFMRAFFTFNQDYFLRLGMLDGRQGLTLAVTDAVNKFFKYAKLSELTKINRGGR